MKNIFIWIGVCLIIAATIIGQFTGVAVSSYIELAGFAVGLATCILGITNKAEKKDWKLYVSIIGITISSILLVFAGLIENQIATLISAVAGVVVLIVSILPTFTKKK